MNSKLSKINVKYKDLAPYAIFGVLTTAVNIISYWILAHLFHMGVMPSTIVSWVLSVTYAFFTNRRWVFKSKSKGLKAILKEMVSFFMCRLLTGFIDWGSMFVFVDVLHFNDLLIKILANMIVIVINYVASKFIIFTR